MTTPSRHQLNPDRRHRAAVRLLAIYSWIDQAGTPGGRGSNEDAAVQKILFFRPQPLEGSI
jgi:hypothetical protein